MSRNLVTSVPRVPRRRFPIGLAVFGGLLIAVAVAVLLALETAPRTGGAPPPDAAVAREALAAGRILRDFVKAEAPDGRIVLPAAQIDALLASAARLAPGASGVARLAPDGIRVELSLGGPWIPAGLWANLSLGIAAPEAGFEIRSAQLGRLPLPPGLVQAALVRGLDRLVDGEGLAPAGLAGITGVAVADGAAVIDFAYDPAQRARLADRLAARLARSAAEAEPIRAQVALMHAEGAAAADGSMLPFLHLLVGAESDAADAGSGLLALAVYCGQPALGAALGVDPAPRGAGNACDPATLGGRDDLKRHFAVSAGIYAASTAEATLGVGELKELFDSGDGGSGFSFDDLAADLAGARFAAVLLATPPAGRPALRAQMTRERDILPETADLPSGLSEAEFAARFGDVDSPAYAAMVAEITRRIDALPFHRAAAGG